MAFRTQKISQMTPKGANLEATDLIEVSTIESGSYVTRSITGQEIIDAAVGNVDWGDIGGTLSAQTDLQSALDAKVPTSRTLTINGVTQDLSADRTFTISTGITIGSTAIASGTVGRVLFQGTGNVVQQSSNLFWDATNNRLGIGTSTPTNALTLGAAVAASLQSSAATIFTSNENASNVFSQVAASNDPVQRPVFAGLKSRGTLLSPTAVVAGDSCTTFLSSAFDGTAGQASAALSFDAESNASSGNAPQLISFITGTSGATRTTKMQVRSNGNVLINTTTDAGFRLDVNGTARVQGNTTISSGTNSNIRLSGTSIEFSRTVDGAYNTYITKNGSTNSVGLTFAALNSGSFFFESTSRILSLFGSTLNVGINTTTDAGFRLDVNGTARVKGTGNTSATSSLVCDNSDNVRYLDVKNDGNIFVKTTRAFRHEVSNGVFYFDLGNIIVRNGDATAASTMSIGKASTADASSILDLVSTTRGFLPPRMTTTQKNAIASPAAGLMVYDTTLNVISYYNGSMWI